MIRVDGLCLDLPGFSLRDVSFEVPRGGFFAVMGPTGSGKTLILETIAGLLRPSGGVIRVAGRDVARLPPERRGVSLVYQDHALFPHLSVLRNVRYGQRYHGIHGREGRDLAMELLERLGMERQAHRSPVNLSGGEKQRVSLARALACKPKVVLLDEPLSSLDPQFRDGLRQTLRGLHRESGVTFLMVTHDFTDALTLASRAGVLRGGRLEQRGTVREIFRRPATPFVADFVGMRNVFEAECSDGLCRFAGLEVRVGPAHEPGPAYAGLRPEDMLVEPGRRGDGWHVFRATVASLSAEGFAFTALLRRNGHVFAAQVDQHRLMDQSLEPGREVLVGFEADRVHIFSR
ncbi:ABC transporter ATP-binding protein [Desulfohalovibrio reitneri]|uniref:ABC transporter ATP-binding protein n=1 Tax=Desulfohalovibrio reitneri TaxID=1307759 RepID=UPI00055937F2|nr:ABC transporter ATP-binding protein [Desulfohalovibrio reitneri]